MSAEVRSVPEGWREKSLGNVIDLLAGMAFNSGDFSDAGIPLLRGDNIAQGVLRWEDAKYWNREVLDKFNLSAGDIVIAMDRPWVTAGLKWASVQDSDLPCLLVQRVARLRGKPELAQVYLKQLVSSDEFSQYLRESATGGHVPHISNGQIASFPLLLPPLPEQRKIAAILSTWDDSLATLTNLLAAKRQQKRGLAEALLTGQTRLPGFAGEWEERRFEEIFETVNSKKFQIQKAEYLLEGQFPIVDQGQKFIVGYSDNDSPFSDVPVILFGDHTREIKWIDFPFFPGADGTVLLRTKSQAALQYGYQLLEVQEIPSLGYSRHLKLLKEMRFLLPPLPEQQAIASVLSTLDGEIASLEALKAKVQEQKRGLMDELLTGRIRVKVEG